MFRAPSPGTSLAGEPHRNFGFANGPGRLVLGPGRPERHRSDTCIASRHFGGLAGRSGRSRQGPRRAIKGFRLGRYRAWSKSPAAAILARMAGIGWGWTWGKFLAQVWSSDIDSEPGITDRAGHDRFGEEPGRGLGRGPKARFCRLALAGAGSAKKPNSKNKNRR